MRGGGGLRLEFQAVLLGAEDFAREGEVECQVVGFRVEVQGRGPRLKAVVGRCNAAGFEVEEGKKETRREKEGR